MKRIFLVLLVCAFAPGLAACAGNPQAMPLPPPSANAENQFGIDENINMDTIDEYLGRDDVAYIDVRMLFDPADYGAIGGEADLTRTIKGFKVVPYPYIATMQPLPVDGAYAGDTLYTVAWNAGGGIDSARPNYEESGMILAELFPQDKAVFLMCGGGGYSGMMKTLLAYLGWDESKLYNIGGNWEYTGDNDLELVQYPEAADGDPIYATWRADYAYIDFDRLHKVS